MSSYIEPCRDCILFAFMNVLQEELNDICDMWNVHRIRADRAGRVSGIPDELIYLPELRGVCLVIVATSCSM